MNNLMKNYKYRTREAALLDLLEGSVFFADSSQFHTYNDSLEGGFVMETSASTFSHAIVNALNEIMINRGDSKRYSMNQIPGLEKMVIQGNNDFINQANILGIYSASTTYDNQAMWVHYCKNEGVCFELEWEQKLIKERHLIISKVEYTNNPRIVNRDLIYKNMLKEFGVKHPDWSIDKILEFSLSIEFRKEWMQEFIIKSSSIKRMCWDYEDETRILSPRSQPFTILKKILKSVYMFIPQFENPDFQIEINKSRLLRMIWVQLVDNYPDVKFFGLSFDEYGKLNKQEIRLRKHTQ